MHFRAPPDVRGSGKERGHGTELKYCPKCGKELKPGKHHVGCTAGKSAPRQAAKRQKQISSTTDSDWVTQSSPSASGELDQDTEEEARQQKEHQNNIESAMRRRVSRARRQASSRTMPGRSKECHVENISRCQLESNVESPLVENGDLVFTDKSATHNVGFTSGSGGFGGLGSLDSKDLAEFDPEHPLPEIPALHDEMLRAPSPPPLPDDWDLQPSMPHGGLLFDFDQFDEGRRVKEDGGFGEPLMTVTSAMNPSEVSNPSDDYIWQILFAGKNDPVPKRVTAHLHTPMEKMDQPSPDLAGVFDDEEEGDFGVPNSRLISRHNDIIPPPPPEVWNVVKEEEEDKFKEEDKAAAAAAEEEESKRQPKTVTVTYLVNEQGGYSVKSVEPGKQGSD